MPQFPHDHVFILPHAEENRRLYDVSIEQVLSCLNTPDLHEGLAEDHYTVEKSFAGHCVYVYYYLTLPLQGERDEAYVIVDFIVWRSLKRGEVTHETLKERLLISFTSSDTTTESDPHRRN